MDKNILFLFIIHSLIYEAWSSQLHPIKQYIVSGLPSQLSDLSNLQTISISNTNTKPSANIGTLSTLASLLSSGVPLSQQVSTVPAVSLLTEPNLGTLSAYKSSASLESLSALARLLSPGVTTSQHVPTVPTIPMSLLTSLAEAKPKKEANTVDSELLNNLAIALQLMIVNNILNSPLPETSSTPEPVVVPAYPLYDNLEPVTPISISYTPIKNSNAHVSTTTTHQKPSQSQPYYNQNSYEQQPISLSSPPMPNANFVGSVGFGDSNPLMGSVPPASLGSSRTGFTLMSPYEALSPSSPYSDPVLSSPYGSVISSKKDFQSPYAAMMAADNKDLFSFPMNDLF